MNRRLLVLVAAVALLTATAAAAAASPGEREDIFGQGMDGPTVAVDGAAIKRGANGLSASVSMPTPEPGTYAYPDSETWPTSSGDAGHPEAFSLWVFIFFNPEACVDACDGSDLMRAPEEGVPEVVAGAFNAGGHLVGGPELTITGHVNQRTPAFGGPNAETLGEALEQGHDLAGAEIHLAVAPHGALASELLPAQITTPAGNPNFWWLAFFK